MAVPAVAVCKATKWYGRDSDPNRKMVLENLDMLVDRGNIYGLLGPSGCGKTTLLSCIVGRRRLNHGDIWVLGGRPGCKGSGVPGPRIGYMPQEIALVAEFSVKDAIFYFGRIFGMSSKQMEEKFQFLSDLLELPPEGRLLKNLSGGQQRRVSFAAALVQDPELLILDEPTVGLDPVLRDKIWEFLVQRANAGTTVIITTHYIEETRQAHKIGLLRDGHLLAEDAPDSLLTKFGCDTLEDAFLTLAIRQQGPDRVRALDASSPDVVPERPMQHRNPNNYSSADDFSRMFNASTDALAMQSREEISTTCPRSGSKKGRYKAVFIKSIQQFSRHPGGLIFSLLFPIVQVLAFFSAVGHDPTNLGLAMVNDEAALSPFGSGACYNSSVPSATPIDEETCDLYMLSCWFIESMKQSNLYPIMHESAESAQRAIRDGAVYGAVYVPANFSQALHERFRLGADVDNDTLDTSTISIWLDMSNHQISHFVKAELYHAFERFARRIMSSCQRNPDLVQIPVNFETPVYGTRDPKYTTFMAPGVMMTILFFLAAVITSTLMISDRLEGVWERSAVAGVRPHETLIVHVGIQSTVIVAQTLEMMVFAFVLYELPYKGPIATIGALLFMQGLSGMCYGFLLSVCCSSYTLSFFIATGSFYPMILLCGILWPLEGMSIGLRYVAMALPFTVPSISLRDIMEKGYTIGDQEVYTGFLVTLTWIVATLSLCFLALRIRKN